MKIIDADGIKRDREWVKGKYNLPEINRAPKDKDHWEVVALHENCRDSSMTVSIVPGYVVPEVDMVPIAFNWRDEKDRVQRVVQTTDANGQTGFGMGGGAYYQPPKQGPHWVYVQTAHPTDIVTGLGMLGKRDHWHLEPTFQFVKAEEPEEEDNYKTRHGELLKAMREILARAEDAVDYDDAQRELEGYKPGEGWSWGG